MDTIDKVLATNALSSKYSIAIHAALSVGKKTLNRYYEKTDFSKTYCIVMGISSFICFIITYCSLFSVLHLHHKLNYIKNTQWEDDWIKAAGQLVRDEFDLSYNHDATSPGVVSSHGVRTTHLYTLYSPCLTLHCIHNRLWYAH
jgi:hypothetical protein